MVDGYNRQDYKALKRPWASLGKLVVSKKMLRRELVPFFQRYGAEIDTVTHDEYTYTAKLKMEKRPEERIYLQFVFNDKARLEGFGFAYPQLIYRKRDSPPAVNATLFGAAVDSIVARRSRQDGDRAFSGSILVMDGGSAIYQKHFGYADPVRKIAANDSTLYELASCSKQFTAAAILLLAKDGKLRLDDSVQRFIPGFPYHGITVRHLMTHTSGLPDYERLLGKVWDKSKFADNASVVAALIEHRPKVHFTPDERFEYSNTGYVLLAVIIECASGRSYAGYLEEALFRPLGMRHTRVYNTRRSRQEVLGNYAYGYVFSEKQKRYVLPDSTEQYRHVVYQDAITGDGTVNSCTADLLLWERELLLHRLLDEAVFRELIADRALSNGKRIGYGYGFFLRGGGAGSERLVFHTGGWPGYVCILMNFFDQGKQIVVLSNNSYTDFTRIADDVAALLVE